MSTKSNALQLKIVLAGSRPSIWREVLVPDRYSFFDLHVAVQDAFGWTDSHLHGFTTARPYGKNEIKVISFPYPDDYDMQKSLDERKVKLSEWLKSPKDSVWYEYDFGDGWMHEVQLKKIELLSPKFDYPILLDGANHCPPEDCGGLGGYYDLLQVLSNPKDIEHENMLEWLGLDKASDFDPAEFDKDAVEFRDPRKVLKEHQKGFGVK